MKTFTHTTTISAWLESQRKSGKTIGFVPTMGALHDGHLSLVRASKKKNDITVCSLFVNPSQFNDSEDLQKYPRNHDVDMAMLIDAGCEVTFLPSVMEVYPPGLNTKVNLELGDLERRLEGVFRPGHFDGMLEVVHRMLQITHPHRLYMGQKDYQQQAIVRHMIEKLNVDVELVVCPIMREADGLAMSSRNTRLTPAHRAIAPLINQTIKTIASNTENRSIAESKEWGLKQLSDAGLKPEYIDVCDGKTLKSLANWDDSDQIVVLAAAWAGNIRLIDNVVVSG
jgi:pantoate--beta-alanine ligase